MAGGAVSLSPEPQQSIFPSDDIKRDWVLEMIGLGYLEKRDGRYEVTKEVQKKDKLKVDFITRTITDSIYEIEYNELDPSDIYMRKRGTNDPFIRASSEEKGLKNIIVSLYKRFFRYSTHRETEAVVNNVLDNITKRAELGNGLWYAGENLYWDSEGRSLIHADNLDGRCSYREIGSTSRNSAVSTALVEETYNYWTNLLDEKTVEFGEFENFYRDLPVEHEHFKLWACIDTDGGVDRYWDMCIATSTIFMYSPPPVVYIPKGKPRGGKSTFIKHLHYLVGNWQTSNVQISQLADPHFNNLLFGSLLNAPDEDKSGNLSGEVTAIFKSLAAKEPCTLAVLYSTKPKQITLKIPMFFPRNVLPEFGSESAACMKRLRFIFCNADLSEFDRKPIDFVKTTFIDNPDYLAKYVGFLLALCAYFSKHGMWYSEAMQRSSDYVAEFINSATLYYNTWKKYFVGYESFDLLWADYQNFCVTRGHEMESKDNLREAFSLEGQNRVKKYYTGVKKEIWMYLTSKSVGKETFRQGYRILCRDEYIKGVGTAEERVLGHGSNSYGNNSMVDILDNIAREAEANFNGGVK